jgi:filamentous hemagglutinin family protein
MNKLLALAFFLAPAALCANPAGEIVAAGKASFDRTPGVLSIRQDTDRAIINWQDFSIGAGDLTRFIQPGANAAALNRVLGGNPSAIYGTLQANGQVILLNPAGILVGSGGRVDTRGFIASTLNLSDESFLNRAKSNLGLRDDSTAGHPSDTLSPSDGERAGVRGTLKFSGDSSASVRNAGTIVGGNVYLIARSVDNSGSISGGNVGLVGASEVILGDAGQGVAVLYGSGSVNNSGLIDAATADLRAAGGNVYALAINNSGVVRASTVANEGGKIVLKADGGVTTSSGTLEAKGGEVQVLGARVGLTDNAVVDVSGGGTALIGGDFQGKNPSVLNAQRTFVGPGASISADGGKVIVWADGLTAYSGSISAQGGSVEVSGKESLLFNGSVDALNVLLDPRDITIQIAGANDSLLADSQILFAEATIATDVTISASALTALTGNIILQADRDIIVNAALSLTQQTAGESVTFRAGDDLTINAAVSTSGASLTLNASDASGATPVGGTTTAALTIGAPVGNATTGAIVFDNTGGSGLIVLKDYVTSGSTVAFNQAVSMTGGSTVTGVGVTFGSTINGAQALTINDAGTTTLSGSIGATTALTSLTTDATGTTALGASTTTIATTGAQTYNDAVTLGANTTLSSSASGNISLNSTVANGTARSLTVNTAGVTKFGGAVGAATALLSVTTDAAGTTLLQGGSVRTTDSGTSGGQTYNDDVVIAADTTLTDVVATAAKPITFGKTVNADLAGNNRALTLVGAGGTNTFSGIVGGTQRLGTLTTDSGVTGLLIIGTTAVSSEVQTYNRPVRISTSTTLTATDGSVTFNQPVNAATANSQTLTINSSGATTFNSAAIVGGTAALGGLTTDSAGSTAINANITSSAQDYNDPVTIGANLTLTSASTISLDNTVNGDIVDDRTLTLSAVGTTTIGGVVGGTAVFKALTSNNGGTTAITTASVNATTITISDAVTIAAATTTLTATAVTLSGTVNGASASRALVINANGLTTLSGAIGGTTALGSISTDAPGTLTLSANVTTSLTGSSQTYREPVTLGGTATLTAATAGANVTFSSTINATTAGAQGLTINAAGTTTIPQIVGAGANGVIDAGGDDKTLLNFTTTSTTGTLWLNGTTSAGVRATTQSYAGPVVLANNTTMSGTTISTTATTGIVNATTSGGQSLTVNATTTSFGGAIGGTTRLSALTTDATGTTTIRNVSTTGAQTYSDPLTLAAAPTTFDSNGGGAILIGSTLGGAFALTVNTSGATTFTGAVSGLTTLTTDSAGTTVFIAGASTSGAQTYNDPVTIGTGATAVTHTFASTGSGAINFANTVNGSGANKSLTVNTAGTTTFGGIVGGTTALAAITTDNGTGSDTTAISTSAITVTGALTFNDDVSLTTGTTLTSATTSFALTLNGAQDLTVNTSGATTFTGIVGGTAALTSLTTDSAGTAVLGANITTVNAITINDPVTLNAAVTLANTASAITFGSTVNGAQTLTLNTTGTATFGGAVGATTQLTSITSNAGGTMAINTTSMRATTQTYNDAVSLGATPTITGTTVTFASTLNADSTANNRQLTVNATTTAFSGAVGGTGVLGALTTDSTGTTTVGANISATTVTLNDAVTVSGGPTVAATTATFASTVNGASALTVNPTSAVTFGSTVGAATALASLTLGSGGTATLTGNVSTSGAQTYGGPVRLAANTTLASSGSGAINLANTVNADLSINNRTLTVNTAGLTTLGGAVGGTAPLSSLITDAPGTLTVNSGTVAATTIGFGDPATLTAATTLTGNNITLAGLNGAFNLTVSGTGTTTLNGDIGDTAALAELKFDNDGTTVIAANITTTGRLTFNDAVTLSGGTGATRTLNSGASDMTFGSTINGDPNLDARSTGATTFAGAVGGTTALDSVTTNAGGTLVVSGGSIRTDAGQTYNETMLLGANTTLTGTTPTFNAASVTGGGYDLTLNFSNNHTVDGSKFTGIRHLTTGNGGNSDLIGTINVTGRQTYNDDISQSGNTTLQASDVILNGSIANANTFTLTINATGSTVIGDAVSDSVSTITTLTIGSGGSTTINAGSVMVATQSYSSDVVFLEQNTTIDAATALTLGSVIGNGKNLSLVATGAKTITAGSTVVGIQNLTVSGGTLTLNGGSISTTGTQSYSSPITLSTAAQTFTSTGSGAAGDITFNAGATINGAQPLTVNSAGTTSFLGTVGNTTDPTSLTVGGGGTTLISANLGAAAGGITITDAVSLGANIALDTTASGAIVLSGTVNGNAAGRTLTITPNSNAAITLGGAIGGATPLAALTTSGTSPIALNDGAVTTTGDQVYGGLVTLGANTTLTGTAGGRATFTTGVAGSGFDLTLDFSGGNSDLDPAKLNGIANFAIENPVSNTVMLGGTLTTSGSQTFNQNFQINGNFVHTSTGGGNITFNANVTSGTSRTITVNTTGTTTFGNEASDVLYGINGVTINAGGTTVINMGSFTVAGPVFFGDAVSLGSDFTVDVTTSPGNGITFDSTINGARTLSMLLGTGTANFNGAVGGTTPLSSLTVNSSGGDMTIYGGSITTSGAQSYTVPVKIFLGANTTLTGTSITFPAGGFDGSDNLDLTLNFSGTTTVVDTTFRETAGDRIQNLTFLHESGPINMAGTLTTTGSQTYNGPITLTAAATLGSTGASSAGSITLNDTINGNFALIVNSDGRTTFAAAVGGTTALASLTTDLNAGAGVSGVDELTVLQANVTTQGATGAIDFNDALTLGANATLVGSHTTAGSNAIDLAAVSSAGYDLTLNTTGGARTVLGGALSGVRGLITNADGTTRIGANVTTTGNQTYNDAVTLTSAAVLTGVTPSFTTIDAASFDLTLTFSGTTALAGANLSNLGALTSNGGGTTTINGSTAIATAAHKNLILTDAVQLIADSTLTATGTGRIDFGSTVNSDATPRALTLNCAATTIFFGAVGGSNPLASLTTDAGVSTQIRGGSITTTGAQTYGELIELESDTTLTGTTPTFFATAVDGDGDTDSPTNRDLTLNFTGTTTLTSTFTGIKNLATGNGGGTTINGDITTTGTQTYNDAVTVAGGAVTRTLTSTGSGSNGNVSFNSTINATTANTERLTVLTSGSTLLAGSIGLGADGVFGGGDDKQLFNMGVNPNVPHGGGVIISGGTIFVTTMNVVDTVTLTGGTVFKGADLGLGLDSTVAINGGGHSLTLSGTGLTTIRGNILNLGSLIRDAGTTSLGLTGNPISITTTGTQFYQGAISLSSDTTLTGSSVSSATTSLNSPGTTSVTGFTMTVNIVP